MNCISARALIAVLCFLIVINGFTQKTFYADKSLGRATSPDKKEQKVYSIYLLGDLKYPGKDNINFQLVKNYLKDETDQSTLVVLGDIVYPLGMPDSTEKGFDQAVRDHEAVLWLVDGFKGNAILIPGNHDWARSGKDGYQHILNQEAFLSSETGKEKIYYPGEGCPGPVEISLSEDIVLIIFDSQWYFHKYDKPGLDGECDFEDMDDLFVQIEDAIRRNRDRKVIFATHHPLFSVGIHGGYFPAYDHIFPLTEVVNWLYVPLPGFIYTGYRKFLGSPQDLAHPDYKAFKAKMLEILNNYPDVIYAAGHEHNLQYVNTNKIHHIVSGGAGEATYIARRKKKADFAYAGTGFARLNFYADGDVWLEYIGPDNNGNPELIFCKKLFNKKPFDPVSKKEKIQQIDFSDSTVRVKLSDIYNRGKFARFWMGDNYRDIWNMEVDLPVFDLGSAKGGLSIIKRGGGQQTRSVRLEDINGKQYVLRSVNKFVENALADNMQNTLAEDIVQDEISASHPYAALTVPELADAAGVMHTNPEIVWVPRDPRLGIYLEEMANGIFLFEERPAGNRSDIKSFGYSEDIENTGKIIKKTQDEHNHVVDQEAVLRARLLDILINDWDRHDDQWRWAKFKEGDTKIYRPIPRDRDQVYFVNQGVLMWMATRNWAMRKFQGFDYEIKDVKGLGYNARFFDRTFLTEPELDDWLEISRDLQRKITDSIIHKAVTELPGEVYASDGIEIEMKLRSRRDDLDKYASQYYHFLARAVDIVGTDERELFEVLRHEDGVTEVSIFAVSDKRGRIKEKLYYREFNPNETNEIRLYGLKGRDKFILTGDANKGIKVRIIPGKGKDTLIDLSRVDGPGKKTIVYERRDKKNYLQKGRETRLVLSNDKSIDDYNRKQFKYNKTMPLISAGYNIDDGLFIGGGIDIKRYNFRDSSFHKITGQLAFMTAAFGISYEGLVSSFSRTFDLEMDAELSLPRNVDNFYGIGNQTQNVQDNEKYYRVRYEYAYANPRLKHKVGNTFDYSFGAFYQYFKVTDTLDKYVGDLYPSMLDSMAFIPHHYSGINLRCNIDTRNNLVMPIRGIHWETNLAGYYSILDEGKNFIKLRSDLSLYLSFKKDPRIVFAFRFGGSSNIGDYEFYHANFLGGKTNLRGFRSKRFAGDHSFYQNTEMRLNLIRLRTYVFNGQAGILLFNDIGRVWVAGEDSESWHDGFGAGIWLTPFDYAAITLTYNRSGEESMIDFSLSFSF